MTFGDGFLTTRSVLRRAPPSRNAGFTILEIMIATLILTLGLIGILALFPVAIHYGKQIVENSTASVIAESVADAIRQGLRNNLRTSKKSSQEGTSVHYFIFKHDGVKDPIPNRIEQETPDKDFYILLPRFRPNQGGLFPNPDTAQRSAKTFVYPETDATPNGGGSPFLADDDGDDYQHKFASGETLNEILVDRTYPIGDFLPSDDPSLTGESVLEDQKIEALKQYSYAFEIQASTGDANLDWSNRRFEPANRLYRVRVLIYRGFPKTPEGQRAVVLNAPIQPVFELDFEVSI